MKRFLLIIIAAMMTLSLMSCTRITMPGQAVSEDGTNTTVIHKDVPDDLPNNEPGSISKDEPVYDYEPMVYYNVGDTVTFGEYEQNNRTNDGAEPIEWTVLEKRGDAYLLLSRYGLDCRSYNNVSDYVTWESCSLRSWLNNSFYNTAFSSSEKSKICEYRGYDSSDMVFCLSGYEVEKYLPDAYSRRADATPYAEAKGAYTSNGFCGWWLRGRGVNYDVAARVNIHGEIMTTDSRSEGGVERIDYSVRPAIWVEF
ncbi:MAG: hypothetical protein IJA55_10395 [Clostridia bacterium]|nr:hypothetical protein [Clostridia bacterium]